MHKQTDALVAVWNLFLSQNIINLAGHMLNAFSITLGALGSPYLKILFPRLNSRPEKGFNRLAQRGEKSSTTMTFGAVIVVPGSKLLYGKLNVLI